MELGWVVEGPQGAPGASLVLGLLASYPGSSAWAGLRVRISNCLFLQRGGGTVSYEAGMHKTCIFIYIVRPRVLAPRLLAPNSVNPERKAVSRCRAGKMPSSSGGCPT